MHLARTVDSVDVCRTQLTECGLFAVYQHYFGALSSAMSLILPTMVRRVRFVLKFTQMRQSRFAKEPGPLTQPPTSALARIDDATDDPVDLFRSWRNIATKDRPHAPDVCCLATVSKDYKVGARNVILREFDNNGFVFVTDNRSRKANDLESVPNAAMCFYWNYTNDSNERILRQVRVEGIIKKLQRSECERMYDSDPFYFKIRSHICHQDQEVDWDDLKRRHDEFLDDVLKGKANLSMPDHFIAYKLQPLRMDFYFAKVDQIADRMYYWRDNLTTPWQHHRIAA